MREAQKRHKASSPPWERIFEVDFEALERRSAPLSAELADMLRLFDGTRTLRAVVDAGGSDGLKRFGALEREKLLATATKAPAVVDVDDDEALDAWLAEAEDEDAPVVSRSWLRWSIAPAAAALAIAAVALLRPASKPAATVNAGATPAAIVAAANANSAPAAATPTAASDSTGSKDTAATTVANAASAVPVAADKPAAAAVVAAAAPAADKPAAVEAAPVATTTATADVAVAAKSQASSKVEMPAPAKDGALRVAAKLDSPAAPATKMDAPAPKADAPATVLASASAPATSSIALAKANSAPAKANSAPVVAGVGGNGAVEKGGPTVAAKTTAPVAPAATGAPDPARYAALLAEGKSRYAKGQIKAARTALLAAMQLDPSRTDALVPLARCQLDAGALDDAVGNARRAIAARGDDADAWLIVGAVEQQRSHASQARVAYQKYLTLAPNAAYAGDVRAVLRTLH